MTDITLLQNRIEFPKDAPYKNEAIENEIFEKADQIKEKIDSYINEIKSPK